MFHFSRPVIPGTTEKVKRIFNIDDPGLGWKDLLKEIKKNEIFRVYFIYCLYGQRRIE